jgi:hypothetical protein
MSRLLLNSTPAERERLCSFAETFVDAAKVADNGGVITGTPAVNFGCNLNGTTDYITYGNAKSISKSVISVVVEFYPDFAADDGVSYYIANSATVASFRITKYTTNALIIALGNTETVLSCSLANFTSYWNVGARNVLVITGTSGNNHLYLNGVELAVTSNSVAWNAASPSALVIGSQANGTSKFDGRITSFKVFNTLLTKQEAIDYWNNANYSYRNRATLDLPMRIRDEDQTNTGTLNVGSTGGYATLVHAPPKVVDGTGYDFDGSNDCLTATGTGVYNTAEVGIVMEFTPDFDYDDNNLRYLFDSTSFHYRVYKHNNAFSNVLNIGLGAISISNIASATYSPFWRKGRRNVLIISGTTGNTNAWLNGNQILTANATAWNATNPATIYIGAANTLGSNFDGKIHSFWTVPRLITPLQVEDIMMNFKKKANYL